MQALSDDQHIAAVEAKVDRLEKKVDDGFAEMRAEFTAVRNETREDFREVRGEIASLNRTIMTMWLTMTLGFAGILLQHHL
jgi:hypothetical protein